MILLIHTQRLTLQTLDETFAPHVAAFLQRNRAFLAPWSPAFEEDYFTPAYQHARLQVEAERMARGDMLRLWLFHRDDTRQENVIGSVSLSSIVRGAFQSCYLGYQLAEAENGKGLMAEALHAAVYYAFEDLQLHRIEANIMPRNVRSRRLITRLGFVEEGYARQYLKINGVWEDHIHYVRLNQGSGVGDQGSGV